MVIGIGIFPMPITRQALQRFAESLTPRREVADDSHGGSTAACERAAAELERLGV